VVPGYGTLKEGAIVIASITSCTNTSNPGLVMGAGLIAKKAVEKGLKVPSYVKTSLAPGSQVATEYLKESGLLAPLEELGFNVAAYGCATCIGNSGPLAAPIEEAIKANDLTVGAVLSGNRNFEGRVHPLTKSNYLASPPLVVAYGLAGTVNINMETDPIGQDQEGNDVFLKDIWYTADELNEAIKIAANSEYYKDVYSDVFTSNEQWNALEIAEGETFAWEDSSTYIREPSFFEGCEEPAGGLSDIADAAVLGYFGDFITTDHISPAGVIPAENPTTEYLTERGVEKRDFNSFGSRRGNHEVMMRGTFGNIRIDNKLVDRTGGFTAKDGKVLPIYTAAMEYIEEGKNLVILAGQMYGAGSSRDWAAKGTKLQGVKAVLAESFERIHRSNLVGMGVVPCEFLNGETAASLGLTGQESFTITGIASDFVPGKILDVKAGDKSFKVKARVDTPLEIEYLKNGGVLNYVLRNFIAEA
jgi:aconitate hydratase